MGKFKDEIGNVYGNITVIKRVPNHPQKHCAMWLYRCQCGVEKTTTGGDLRFGKVKSCGCDRSDRAFKMGKANLKAPGHSSFVMLYNRYACTARNRGYVFNLDKDQFKTITQSICHYCGIEPKQIADKGTASGTYLYNGVDRVDNNLGYEPYNVVPCCTACNMMKRLMSKQEFIDHVKRIAKHQERG